jgi:L-aminopeptidase/D-esterase-like protein
MRPRLNLRRRTVPILLALALALLTAPSAAAADAAPAKPRARALGIPFDGTPGPLNAVTDVPGVLVGHSTVIAGEGARAVRTGVTAVKANAGVRGVWAAVHSHNGDGELTGSHFIAEKGWLISPVLITNTLSVGTVHEATIRWSLATEGIGPVALPVVGETWDGDLNDIYGLHVEERHVFEALNGAAGGPVAEGNVGGGTGMVCHGFKGGIGTASRVLPEAAGGFAVGVLVQANYGSRGELRIAGIPVGREIAGLEPAIHEPEGAIGYPPSGDGSIIVVVATDAPLLPHQLRRVLRRVPMGLARAGSYASTWSGDIFVAFSTVEARDRSEIESEARYLRDPRLDAVFLATVQAVEEAIVNALVAAETMTGIHGNTVHALPHDQVREILRRHGRLVGE